MYLTQVIRKAYQPADGGPWVCRSCAKADAARVGRRDVEAFIEGWADRAETGIAAHCRRCDVIIAQSAACEWYSEGVAKLRGQAFAVPARAWEISG